MTTAPTTSAAVSPETRARVATFGKTTRRLRGLEYVVIGGEAVTLIARVTSAETSLTYALATVVTTFGGIAAVVYLIVWMNRGCALVPLLGRRPRPYTQTAIVFGFIIPILSFFRPYQVMRSIDVSVDPNALPVPPVQVENVGGGYREPAFTAAPLRAIPAALVGAWWAAYLISGVLQLVANKMAENPGQMEAGTLGAFGMLGDMAGIVSAGATIVVVGQIRARAQARLERLDAQTAG